MAPAPSLPRRKRIATPKSSCCCSPALITTSPHNMTTPSASGRGCCCSIATTPRAVRTASGRALFPLQSPPARAIGAAVARAPGVAPPRRGEVALARARALAADGHLRDALTTLDLVRPTDPQKAEADRLRGEIQLQLIALTSVPAQPPAESHPQRAKADRPVP